MDVIAVGGYEEVGRNMTAIRIDNEVVIFDMGLCLDKLQDDEEGKEAYTTRELVAMGAMPDDTMIPKNAVVGIVCSHGHLDHIGAIDRLASAYNCPIIGTRYTIELIRGMAKSQELVALEPGKSLDLSSNFALELVHVTHSIPHATIATVRTPEGIVAYANDFKFDNYPILDTKPDYMRLKKLGREGVNLLIVESVRVAEGGKSASESVARELLKDLMITDASTYFLASFSSHIERIHSICEFAKRMGRKPVFLGRSLKFYVATAEKLGIINLPDNVTFVDRYPKVKRFLEQVHESGTCRDYVFIATGNQGEPNAVLSRLAIDSPLPLTNNTKVVFASETIPSPINVAHREILERRLRTHGVRIYKDAHVSGHARREDHRDLIRMLQPENIVPSHGEIEKLAAYAELASEEGYDVGKNLHLMHNGKALEI
ncbi:MAG TPA: RNase J family beta-CASP ribonuclease [Methanomicrobia archaeon]|nr:RNase J family beta-CASP ribonuclease [Methanomicrobia archaeon]